MKPIGYFVHLPEFSEHFGGYAEGLEACDRTALGVVLSGYIHAASLGQLLYLHCDSVEDGDSAIEMYLPDDEYSDDFYEAVHLLEGISIADANKLLMFFCQVNEEALSIAQQNSTKDLFEMAAAIDY